MTMKITLLTIINGTAGARIAGSKPPDNAMRLGMSATTKALRMPTKNYNRIKIALIIGPVNNGRWT